ncbi:Bax inhibitor-1 family protein [Ralstonia solanacearum]|uniref:Bax inhibitor-1 family protein n=1 Tax=Ralstonia solanacearum TaxID=305 RepID=UPI002F9563C9
MDNQLNTYGFGASGTAGALAVRNRVLRNTYWLLALSMAPTILGAWIGVTTRLHLMAGRPLMGFLVFMGVAFGFFYAIKRFKNSGVGVALLLGFTFFMGLMLSPLLGLILGFSNGAALIMTAFGGTATIFAVMATVATVSKRDFSGLGKWLFMGVLVLTLGSVANIWLQLPSFTLTLSVLTIAVFSAYMLYDVQRIVNGGETNYVTATLAIYLDVYIVFTRLLMILGILGGNRD